MNKTIRILVFEKFNGRCAYCGKRIELSEMQIDHIIPVRNGGLSEINNYNPSCRRCNHYKRTQSLKTFRNTIKTLHKRVMDNYINKVAEDYGIITITEWDGEFYFEKAARR